MVESWSLDEMQERKAEKSIKLNDGGAKEPTCGFMFIGSCEDSSILIMPMPNGYAFSIVHL